MSDAFNPVPRLRWSFWLVLFTPVITSVVLSVFIASQTTGLDGIGPLVLGNLFCGIVLNLICSMMAGRHYAQYRNPEFHNTSKVLGWAFLFFLLNLILLPAGFALAGVLAKHLAK